MKSRFLIYYFRDRVIREERYKLFVGIDRQPEKLVDVINDPEEGKNLMGNPELATVLARHYQPVASMPTEDNDPIYTHDPDYPDYKKDGLKSQLHRSATPTIQMGVRKIRKRRKRKNEMYQPVFSPVGHRKHDIGCRASKYCFDHGR